MPNALFAFEDRDAAIRARAMLMTRGMPADTVRLHAQDQGPNDAVVQEVDELVTGGFLHNFMAMWQGVFEWGDSPHAASAYAETIRRGGGVLRVHGDSDADKAKVEEVMVLEAPDRRTAWSDAR